MRVLALGAAVGIAGCSTASDDTTATETPGGFIRVLQLGDMGGWGGAEFYSDVVGTAFDPRLAYVPMDSCDIRLNDEVETESATETYIDIGDMLELVAPTATLELEAQRTGTVVTYWGYPTNSSTKMHATSFDVVFPGNFEVPEMTWPAALYVPDVPALVNTAADGWLRYPDGQGLEVQWAPRSLMHIYAALETTNSSPEAEEYLMCRWQDDGAFVIPPEQLSAVPKVGLISVTAVSVATHDLGGRSVDLVGATIEQWSYGPAP